MSSGVHEEDQMEMDSTEMWYIMTRKQQLQGRRALLVGLHEFLKKNNFSEGSFHQEDDHGRCELEQIDTELRSLSEREWELRNGTSLKENQSTGSDITEESSVNVQSPTEEPTRTTPAPVISVNTEMMQAKDLSFNPAVVCCPICQQHVTTEIQHKVGNTSFLVCYLSIFLGCVGGCCLLPFVLNYFKDTCHFCPSCHTEIQTVSRI